MLDHTVVEGGLPLPSWLALLLLFSTAPSVCMALHRQHNNIGQLPVAKSLQSEAILGSISMGAV